MTFDAIVQERTPSSIVFRLVGSFSEVWLPRAEASEDLPVGAAVRITCELREGERRTEVDAAKEWLLETFPESSLPRSLTQQSRVTEEAAYASQAPSGG